MVVTFVMLHTVAFSRKVVYMMNKTHMTDKAGNPLCECVATGKKMELVAERKDVTCKKCLRILGWGNVSTLLPEGK